MIDSPWEDEEAPQPLDEIIDELMGNRTVSRLSEGIDESDVRYLDLHSLEGEYDFICEGCGRYLPCRHCAE